MLNEKAVWGLWLGAVRTGNPAPFDPNIYRELRSASTPPADVPMRFLHGYQRRDWGTITSVR